MNYKYLDTPEGQDVLKKTWCFSKLTGTAGAVIATYDVLMYSHPKGIFNIVHRYGYWTGPFVGMAAAFTATSSLACNIRGKDDKVNYVLGAISSGVVFGAWQRSALRGFVGSLFFISAAIAKKLSIEEGWKFFPPTKHQTNDFLFSPSRDYSLTKDLPKGWTTDPKKAYSD